MSRVVVRDISPDGLHGFRPGQLRLENLGDGLNVVYAPNATGKSTLANAIGLLLNPQRCAETARVTGIVAVDGVESDRQVRRRDEPFPGAPDRPEDYLLDIVVLLQGLNRDDKETLGRLVGSGLNIAPGSPPSTTIGEVRRASEALGALQAARRTAQMAAEDEIRLPQLQKELENAESAERAKGTLARWQERHRLDARLQTLLARTQVLEAENPGLAKQRESAAKEIELLAEAVRTAVLAAQRAEAEIGKSHPDGLLPSRTLSDAERELLRATAQEATLAIQSLRDAEGEAHRLQAEIDSAKAAILRLIDGEDLAALSGASEDDFKALVRAAVEADEERAAKLTQAAYQRAREEWRAKRPPFEENIEETWLALRQWLDAEPVAAEDPRAQQLMVIVAIASIVIAVIPSIALRIVAALVAAGAAYYVSQSKPLPIENRRPELAARAGLTSSSRPSDAAARLSQIAEVKAWQNASILLEQGILTPLPDSKWREIVDHLRLRTDDPYSLAAVSRSVDEYLRRSVEGAKWQAKLLDARNRLDEAREGLQALYAEFGFPTDSEVPELAREAFLQWFVRAEALATAREAAAKKAGELSAALDEAGIPAGESVEARQSIAKARATLVSEYRALQTEIATAKQSLDDLTVRDEDVVAILGTHPEFATDEQIEMRFAELEQRSQERDRINQEIGARQDRIRNVAQSAGLEQAEAAYGQAAHKVETRWRGLVQEAVGHRIRTHLKDRMRNVDLPDILKAANVWVAEFTSQRYRLVLGAETRAKAEEGLGVLTVYDTRTGREQAFAELSTGTRVHVVLALRLGLIDRHEHQANGGTRCFPLVADEIMAVSDPDASEALARALVEISKVRQVVLFTNQPDDVHVLRRLAPDVTVRTLTSAEIADEAPLPDLRYVSPAGPRRLDLRLPIRSHAASAVLPSEPEEWPADADAFIDALENFRRSLVTDYPRLEWSTVSALPAIRNSTFRDTIAELAQNSGGDARQFILQVDAIKGRRVATVKEIRQWLEDNGYLAEPPTEDELRARLQSAGVTDDPYRLQYLVGLFVSAFR